MKRLSATLLICIVLGLLSLSSAAIAQSVQPPLPGSVQYEITAQGWTWTRTDAPITVGIYVEDILVPRFGQPVGRGALGMVTATTWDAPYGQMAATVDFGRDFSVGIVFSQLSAVTIVPEPSSLLALLPGIGLIGIRLRRRPHLN